MKSNKFDRLFNTIMEEVKSSKKHLIKEDWDVEKDKYEMYVDNHEKTLIGLLKKNDPSKVSQAMIAACQEKGVRKSRFYKWISAMCIVQFDCLDKVEWWKENGFNISPEEEKEINWYGWITQKLIKHQRLAEDWEYQDWTEEILKAGGVQDFLDYADQLGKADIKAEKADEFERATTHQTPMYDDNAEADSLHESKKVNTKKNVILEFAPSKYKTLNMDYIKRAAKSEKPFSGFWRNISANYNLTPEFVREYKDKLNWWIFSRNRKFPFTDEFLEEFKDKINWKEYCAVHKVTEQQYLKFRDKIHLIDLLANNRLRTVQMKVPEIEVWADKYWEDLSDERMYYNDKSERDWLFVCHAKDFSKDFMLKHCTTPRLQGIVKQYGRWNNCYKELMKAWGFNRW